MRFSGNYADWSAWRAQFYAKVYDTNLETHEKIELLAKSLAGEAAVCVGPIINRDKQELDRAWSMLTKRYDNEYQLALLNIESPGTDQAKGLRKIVDTINQQMRMLQRFGFATESWSPLIIAIILRKIDQDTFKEWEKLESKSQTTDIAHMTKIEIEMAMNDAMFSRNVRSMMISRKKTLPEHKRRQRKKKIHA